jgi:predicted TIM-barrel enzyme
VRAVAESAGIPTLVGSGITADNVADYAAADAYIVGSWLKAGGLWTARPTPRAATRCARRSTSSPAGRP